MDTAQHIYQRTCHRCERPALTFDKDGKSLCARHATIFIAAPLIEPKDDEGS